MKKINRLIERDIMRICDSAYTPTDIGFIFDKNKLDIDVIDELKPINVAYDELNDIYVITNISNDENSLFKHIEYFIKKWHKTSIKCKVER